MNTSTEEKIETVTPLPTGTNTSPVYIPQHKSLQLKSLLKTKISIKYTSNLTLLHMPVLSN